MFLLCCLFPEDYDIPIETLVRYGNGLRLLRGIDTMEESSRVHSLIQTLKRSFLLIDRKQEECVKMHDVVRNVTLLIASNKEHGFIVRCASEIGEFPEIDRREDCRTISLVADKIMTVFIICDAQILSFYTCQQIESLFVNKNSKRIFVTR